MISFFIIILFTYSESNPENNPYLLIIQFTGNLKVNNISRP
jgi:hypothetical protein